MSTHLRSEQAKHYPCPACGAAPHEKCSAVFSRDETLRIPVRPHLARLKLVPMEATNVQSDGA